MNWRRGLLLAGINLVAAVPLICLLAAEDAQFLLEREQGSAVSEMLPRMSRQFSPRDGESLVRVQEEQIVFFNPCGLRGNTSPQVSAVQLGNLPALVLSQWRVKCPPRWSVAHMLGVSAAGLILPANFKAMRRADIVLCLMIAVQWFLIGSFPPTPSNRWWGEPGAFISTCNVVAACIAMIPLFDGLARLPALIAWGGWLWWFGLLIWIPARKAWGSTLGGLQRLTH
jgi:hypothetical protein